MKSMADRLQELLIINSSLREEVRELKETVAELLEEILILRERLDNNGFRD